MARNPQRSDEEMREEVRRRMSAGENYLPTVLKHDLGGTYDRWKAAVEHATAGGNGQLRKSDPTDVSDGATPPHIEKLVQDLRTTLVEVSQRAHRDERAVHDRLIASMRREHEDALDRLRADREQVERELAEEERKRFRLDGELEEVTRERDRLRAQVAALQSLIESQTGIVARLERVVAGLRTAQGDPNARDAQRSGVASAGPRHETSRDRRRQHDAASPRRGRQRRRKARSRR